MEEQIKHIPVSESEACRIIWALERLSASVRQSSAPQVRKDKVVQENNIIIVRLRKSFQCEMK